MSIHWGSLLAVFVVSVVALVALGPVEAGRAVRTHGSDREVRDRRPEPPVGAARPLLPASLALLSPTAAAAIVLLGLWVMLNK